MDIYSRRSYWRVALIVFGVIILLVTIVYANYLAYQLKLKEEKDARVYMMAIKEFVADRDLNKDIRLMDTIITTADIRVIIEDEKGHLYGRKFGPEKDTSQVFLENMVDQFYADGLTPLFGPGGNIDRFYWFNSRLGDYIKYFPIVQGVLISFFIALAYFLFNSSKRAEQNRVWAGMAKETAHQLGTPISAILAWIEHMKLSAEDQPYLLGIIEELTRDVGRLELIADRFSKIGSAPSLQEINIYEKLEEIKDYMKRRAPKKIAFDFPQSSSPLYVNINSHLFDWVLENLIRNALDAMEATGTISAEVMEKGDQIIIDITDSGKGIPPGKLKTVFQPGYTSKKRGWGLGLSLAKRIIESYHKGKIFVKSSKLNEGTTFSIKLPKA